MNLKEKLIPPVEFRASMQMTAEAASVIFRFSQPRVVHSAEIARLMIDVVKGRKTSNVKLSKDLPEVVVPVDDPQDISIYAYPHHAQNPLMAVEVDPSNARAKCRFTHVDHDLPQVVFDSKSTISHSGLLSGKSENPDAGTSIAMNLVNLEKVVGTSNKRTGFINIRTTGLQGAVVGFWIAPEPGIGYEITVGDPILKGFDTVLAVKAWGETDTIKAGVVLSNKPTVLEVQSGEEIKWSVEGTSTSGHLEKNTGGRMDIIDVRPQAERSPDVAGDTPELP